MEMKQCSKCKEVKSTEEFHRNTASKDGLDYWCKQCHKHKKKKYHKICETCEKPFEALKEATRFCSYECIIYDYNCLNCQKSFVSKSNKRKYCSEKCKQEFVIEFDEKQCVKCGLIKNADDFAKNSSSPTSKHAMCKDCINQKNHERRQKEKKQKYMDSIGYVETDKTIPAEIDMTSIKTCTLCEVDKPLTEFRPVYVKKKFNRFHAHCHECASAKNKEYRIISETRKYKEIIEKGKQDLEMRRDKLK